MIKHVETKVYTKYFTKIPLLTKVMLNWFSHFVHICSGSYTNVWLGPINIGTLVVKGKFVDEYLALNETCSDTKFHVY